jgi:hypothetical protein
MVDLWREEQTVKEDPTCGRGLAQSSAVPAGLAAVAAGLARNLEIHTRALNVGDAAAAHERDVYERVARSLRSAATELQTAAADMASAVDLPMGVHDMAAITAPDVLDAFARFVAAEDDLRRMLDAQHVDNEQMLTAMRSEIGSSETGYGRSSGDS